MAFRTLRAAAAKRGDQVPLYVAIGAIGLTAAIGAHTIRQQIAYAPSVSLKKSRRETVAEVEYPDRVAQESDNFIKKSFFRKLAHVQQKQYLYQPPANDTIRGGGDALSNNNSKPPQPPPRRVVSLN